MNKKRCIQNVFWFALLVLIIFPVCATQGCASSLCPNAYQYNYIGMSMRDVMLKWCECWKVMPEARNLPWLKINLYYQNEDKQTALDHIVIVRMADFPEGKTRWLSLWQSVDDCFFRSPYIAKSSKWSCFDKTLTDWWPFDFKSPRERLSVWFNDSGVVTNQCVESYDVYY